MWLFLVLILVPLIEIALFVTIGGALGLLWTLGIVIGSAGMGALIIRREHRVASAGLRATLHERRDMTGGAALSALGLAAGFLLIAPGFLTDSLGLLLLIPAIRRAIIIHFAKRLSEAHVVVAGVTVSTPENTYRDEIIEGEIVDREDRPAGPDRQKPSALPDGQQHRVNRRH